MRWNSYRDGNTRVARGFAWLPTRFPNGVTVWLEFYSCVERYRLDIEGGRWIRGEVLP
jgi:hypothetical protein